MEKYSKKWFINYFESIPEENWCQYFLKNSQGKSCALGHCKLKDFAKPSSLSLKLLEIMGGPKVTLKQIRTGEQILCADDFLRVYSINDKTIDGVSNPKQNIINFLKKRTK